MIAELIMDIEKMDNFIRLDDDEDDQVLPGFWFHPTDEELVGFYLRRKVDKRSISLELIKHIDIYKYDPWDLPKGSNTGEKEWYFFCRRGRKYRNSLRPNRVTSSGFWKATGIDKPIYSDGRRDCIGLKKSLVYYCGSAGKGTKTDWMMHEFRLPPPDYHHNTTTKNNIHFSDEFQEAEVWTLCRILKRNTSERKCMASWREISTSKRNNPSLYANSKTCSAESDDLQDYNISFTSTSAVQIRQNNEHKPAAIYFSNNVNELNQLAMTSISQAPSSVVSSYSNFSSPEVSKFGRYEEWDELRSIMEFVNDPFLF